MYGNFEISIPKVRAAAAQYQGMYQLLAECAEKTARVRKGLTGSSYQDIRSVISSLEEEQRRNMKHLKKMEETLIQIIQCYEAAESNIAGTGEKAVADLSTKEKGFWESLGDGFNKDFWDNLKSDIVTSALESGGDTVVRIGGIINNITALARGTGENAFIIVNPNVAATTSKIISGGKWIATGAKYGLPVIGGLIDFGGQLAKGEDIGDAAVKATAHVGIGVGVSAAVGAVIGSVFPGPGTVAGAAVGFAAGTIITTLVNSAFDYVYDNWDDVKDYAEEKYNQVVSVLSDAADGIGNAVDGFFSGLGTIFG